MPDLVQALAGMFGSGDMTIFQAVVDTVGQGVVTVHFNGGTFTDVPYLDSVGSVGASLGIGDAVYVIGRKNWGMLVIGRPAPGPDRTAGDSQTLTWAPYEIGVYSIGSGTWTIPGTDAMAIQPGDASAKLAAYFYRAAEMPAIPPSGLATASFYLEIGPFSTGGVGVDQAYIEIGLFQNAVPRSGSPVLLGSSEATYQVAANSLTSQYVSIPLSWATQLIENNAQGIYVMTQDYPTTVQGPGTVRLTTL